MLLPLPPWERVGERGKPPPRHSKAMTEPTPRLDLANPADRQSLAQEAVARQYAADPTLAARYGAHGRVKCLEDAAYHLAYLEEAVTSGAPQLFLAYIDWVRSLLAGLGVPDADLHAQLAVLRTLALSRLAQPAAREAGAVLDAALAAFAAAPPVPASFIDPAAPLGELAARYLDALIRTERKVAADAVLGAAEGGTPVADLYLDVIQRSQREIGRLWQLSRITVGQEHFCTAASQAVIARLYPWIFTGERSGRRMVAACIGGELHELGMRMVADFFEMAGWDSHYLGANVPTASILDAIAEQQADVVGISATMVAHVDPVRKLVAAIRDDARGRRVRILVGGYPFNLADKLWQAVGADGCATDAREAVAAAERLVAS